jgi:signal transduction histidine kinase
MTMTDQRQQTALRPPRSDEAARRGAAPAVPAPESGGLTQTAEQLTQLAEMLVQANRTRSAFLSKVAHELRTPLTIAKGWICMLRDNDLPPDQTRIVGVVEQQIDDLTRLVNDLLDLSRRECGTLDLRQQVVDLASLIEQVAEHQRELTAQQGILLTVRRPAGSVLARVDRGRIAQVLNNLISNACRYVPRPGGRIWLAVAAGEAVAQLTVRDNGIGIPAGHLDHIFTPFYQIDGRQRGKSGLGLAVARELVEAHGGTITVESEPGRGTAFHIWLPRSAAEQPGEALAAEEAA